MTRKARFWSVLALASAAALVFAISHFTRAFPLVSLDLRMNRSSALAAARELTRRYDLDPGGRVREAASFGVDDTVKTFVELEGGGIEAFRDMLRRHVYDAYTWRVRHFREGETREVTLRFRPDGSPCGFVQKLREDAPGAALSPEAARRIAEASAARDWGVNIAPDTLAEIASERRPGGRVDHTFVYERRGVAAGEGRYRVRLVVGGDRLTELTPFLRVPEAFSRRYEELRAANDAIARGAVAAMLVLYVIGGCVVGVVLLLRQRRALWFPALAGGFGVAGLISLASVNEWPLAWMHYDTAITPGTFLIQRTLLTLLGLLGDGCLVALTLTAAEGLGRKAFPDHPQLWRTWSREAAGSRAIVGRTAGGVLLTGLEFGYIIGFYLIATRLWKWWVPAESLVDPNVLATYLPWLSAVAPSLHAGVWEEAMFRAVPLAGAALIGDRFGNRRLWIGIALVVEAVVFGGAHANYASEPAYSRPVELIVPSLVWGLVYLRFGLLPSIIAHYLFDLSLFALPLFTSAAAGSRIDQAFVIACAAVPLGLVAWGVKRQGRLAELPEARRNRAWSPPAEEVLAEAPVAAAAAGRWTPARTRAVLAAGVLGLLAWVVAGSFRADAPPLRIRRPAAISRALDGLVARNIRTEPYWKRLVTVDTDDIQSVFVYRALGPDTYRALIGKDLEPPSWSVRVARFSGDVAERAEEWQAWVAGDGKPWRLRHVLPERREGAALDEAAARRLAWDELRSRFGLEPARLREVSAVSAKHPARLDWTFTFADTSPPRLARGERRVVVEVSGNRVSDAHRLVFVPEDWQRDYRGQNAIIGVLSVARGLVFAAVLMVAAGLGIVAWSQGRFPVRFAVRFWVILLALGLTGAALQWPSLEARFSTAQPYNLQVSVGILGLVLVHVMSAGLMALVAGFGRGSLDESGAGAPVAPAFVGVAAGAIAAGAFTLLDRVFAAGGPLVGPLDSAETLAPWLMDAIRLGVDALRTGSVLLALLMLAHRLSDGWTRRQLPVALLMFAAGGLVVTPATTGTPATWLTQAALAGAALVALVLLVLRLEPRLTVGLVAGLVALRAVRAMARGAHPDAVLGGALGIVVVAVLAVWWWRELATQAGATETTGKAQWERSPSV